MLLEPARHALVDQSLDDRGHLGADQLVLGLRGELGVRHLDGQHAGQALAHVLAGELDLVAFDDAGVLGIFVDGPGKRGAEARQMGAAVALRDVVGEAETGLVVAVVPLHGALHRHRSALGAGDDGRRMDRGLGSVEIADERLEPAVVVQLLLDQLGAALVAQHDPHAGIEKGQLPEPVLERRERELGLGEDAHRRHEGELGAAPAVLRAAGREWCRRLAAVLEADEVLGIVAPDDEVEPIGERVDHRDADAVQPARDLVAVLVELAAGMQHGHDHLGRRDAFALVHVDRNAAAIVGHRHRAVGVERHLDLVGVACQHLVDGVVDHLEDHVVQARAVIRVADIHAGSQPHGLEPLQHPDRGRIVDRLAGRKRVPGLWKIAAWAGGLWRVTHGRGSFLGRHEESGRGRRGPRRGVARCRSGRPGRRAR